MRIQIAYTISRRSSMRDASQKGLINAFPYPFFIRTLRRDSSLHNSSGKPQLFSDVQIEPLIGPFFWRQNGLCRSHFLRRVTLRWRVPQKNQVTSAVRPDTCRQRSPRTSHRTLHSLHSERFVQTTTREWRTAQATWCEIVVSGSCRGWRIPALSLYSPATTVDPLYEWISPFHDSSMW